MHALAVTSDIEYEPALGWLYTMAHEVDGLNKLSYSDYISLKEEIANVTFEATLPTEDIPDNDTVVEVLGIDFYQALGTVYEPFKQGRAAMVIGVI